MTKSCAAPSLPTRFLLLLLVVEPCEQSWAFRCKLSGPFSCSQLGGGSFSVKLTAVAGASTQRTTHSREARASMRDPESLSVERALSSPHQSRAKRTRLVGRLHGRLSSLATARAEARRWRSLLHNIACAVREVGPTRWAEGIACRHAALPEGGHSHKVPFACGYTTLTVGERGTARVCLAPPLRRFSACLISTL